MNTGPHSSLSRRERQIMEIIYRKKRAAVGEIRDEIPSPPSYSAVRATVNILERKGYLIHTRQGKKYLYAPSTSRRKTVHGAIRHMLSTYFDNSLEKAVTAMLELRRKDLSDEEIDRLARLILNEKEEIPP
jgi:BlaI family penicillinase repressor